MKTGKPKKRKTPIRFERSCGNVFADLGLPDAEELLAKSTIISHIHAFIKDRQLTDAAAAKLIGISTDDLDQMIRGDLDRFSKRELQRFLRTLKTCFNGKSQS
jgi:predicted XRE-type DNA-binding protein